jgi:uncharacterized protein YceH (UPF0502 family)
MTTQPIDDAPWNPSWKPLGPEQRRVLGVLIEKAKTTPAGYPMTINAIVLGCNQKNNREPLMTLSDVDVERVLEELRRLGAVTEAHESTRSTKFRHRSYEWLGVERAELAVMAELLLRGAQTLGELRTRAARMEPITDLIALKPIVDALLKRRLMIELTPPGRGQIVSHNLYEVRELAEVRARLAGLPPEALASHEERRAPMAAAPGAPDALVRLRAEIAELRAEVTQLRERIGELESRLTRGSG